MIGNKAEIVLLCYVRYAHKTVGSFTSFIHERVRFQRLID